MRRRQQKAAPAREVRRNQEGWPPARARTRRELRRRLHAVLGRRCKGSKRRRGWRTPMPKCLPYFAAYCATQFDVRPRAMHLSLQSVRRSRRTRARDRRRSGWRGSRLPRSCLPQVDRQQVLEAQPEEAPEQAAVRNGRAHRCTARRIVQTDLRIDPGVRRLRPAGVARLAGGRVGEELRDRGGERLPTVLPRVEHVAAAEVPHGQAARPSPGRAASGSAGGRSRSTASRGRSGRA